MKRSLLLVAAVLLAATPVYAQVANLKVVTDANPDYSDMESVVRSITSNWKTDAEKMYALFYWDHIARRQTQPMQLHGFELTDPIRQYNDYGFLMCSTITGLKCSVWDYMGYPSRYWDITAHTVPDVWYDGAFHHYDNSLSMYYTLQDGKTVAAVEDIGRTMAGPASDGKPVLGYIALYHAVTGTSPDGFCEGADTGRPLKEIVKDFTPKWLKYRYYHLGQERGHRYSLNLRNGEVYTRHYSRQDANSPDAVVQNEKNVNFKADPAYYVPNHGKDPESVNARYRIRGNGERTWTPVLNAAGFAESVYMSDNVAAGGGGANGLVLKDASKPGSAVFKVEGANVITSLKIKAVASGNASLAVSTTNGIHWQALEGDIKDVKLVKEVNGSYEVLVKVTLDAGASLQSIDFNAITALNSKTQPQLKLGKNTVYVGNGEQTGTITLWPKLHNGNWKTLAFDSQNIQGADPKIWKGNLHLAQAGEGYITYKIDAPADITSITYGARMYIKGVKGSIDFLHSFDGGQTWTKAHSFTDNKAPWDAIRFETIDNVPAGAKSVLIKYALATNAGELSTVALYSTHMEVNHKLANPIITGTGTNTALAKPMEVTFNWSERQKDYTTVKRSHTQLVDKLPANYTINVGGYDQPIVDSLTVNLKGARSDVKLGYSDDKDVGGERWVGQWATYGKNIAVGKPYTVSVPSSGNHGSADPDNNKLTDGSVGSPYSGGTNYRYGLLWMPNQNPEITVDLGTVQKCAAFRIHTLGYPFWDAMKGQNKDKVEVFISNDGNDYKSVGVFDSELHWKNIPVNFMYADDETFSGVNFFMPMETPVEARFVKYKVTSPRQFGCTEVQVLEGFKFEPFDLKLAMPDPAQNGKRPPNAGRSPNAKTWKPEELPPPALYGRQIIGTDPLAVEGDGKKK